MAVSFTRAQSDSIVAAPSKIGIAAGLGVSLVNAPDIVDYLNLSFPSNTKFDDFTTAAEYPYANASGATADDRAGVCIEIRGGNRIPF